MKSLLSLVPICLLSLVILDPPDWGDDSTLTDLLIALGDSTALAFDTSVSGTDTALIESGYRIVHEGSAIRGNGVRSERVSRYYVCTDCHNTTIDDPDLRRSDPDARLDLAMETDRPMLQGTTLYGVVDRVSWYNGDYLAQYGARAVMAHTNLRESIQLCAEECSQGRALDAWEMESVLAYLRTIGYRLGDLDLTDEEWSRLRDRDVDDDSTRRELIAMVRSKYQTASPATFADVPADPKEGYQLVGRADRGENVYYASCLHCHGGGRVSTFDLDDERGSFRRLSKKLKSSDDDGFYRVIREGTEPTAKHPRYMPRYTRERLSDQQIEDLRAYIEQRAAE